MNKEEKKQELLKVATEHLPDSLKTIAFLEHQMDLMAAIILDLADVANAVDVFNEDQLKRLEVLKSLMSHSSVNFDDLDNPLQAYKLPACINQKYYTRLIQDRYLVAQMKAGIF